VSQGHQIRVFVQIAAHFENLKIEKHQKMSVEGKAEIGEKAPKWTCKAVVDEEFVDINSR
jgi:hypothetical protein